MRRLILLFVGFLITGVLSQGFLSPPPLRPVSTPSASQTQLSTFSFSEDVVVTQADQVLCVQKPVLPAEPQSVVQMKPKFIQPLRGSERFA